MRHSPRPPPPLECVRSPARLRAEGAYVLPYVHLLVQIGARCFDDVMRSRHDVMFRFADVVLCFDVVRPEMDVTQETQRGIFRGASRCCCSFASLSFLSCKNQPARTQSKRSDFKRRSSSSCVHLAFEWLLFTRNWCWQAQQSNFSRRFALHFPSRAINSTPK